MVVKKILKIHIELSINVEYSTKSVPFCTSKNAELSTPDVYDDKAKQSTEIFLSLDMLE